MPTSQSTSWLLQRSLQNSYWKVTQSKCFWQTKKKVKLFQTAIAALHAQRASNIPPVSSGISSKDVRPLTLLLGGGGKLQWTCSAGPFIYGSSTCCPETVALPELTDVFKWAAAVHSDHSSSCAPVSTLTAKLCYTMRKLTCHLNEMRWANTEDSRLSLF